MSENPTMYEKLGGEAGVEAFVIAFYVRVMNDPQLAPFFRNTSLDKLHAMQKEFFTMALGGPVSYSGCPLGHVHHGRGITSRHFRHFVDHMLATLEDQGVSDSEAQEIINHINSYANEITGVSY